MTTTINEKIKELLKDTSFECYQYEDFDSAEELMESLQEEINQDEVIYYHNAIKYLSENDASLKESLSIAEELGYSVGDINSELLATLLQQRELTEELSNLRSEIESIYEESEE